MNTRRDLPSWELEAASSSGEAQTAGCAERLHIQVSKENPGVLQTRPNQVCGLFTTVGINAHQLFDTLHVRQMLIGSGREGRRID